ncbi:GMC family oxidoreductase [Haloarchaeobius salinus]|uniref:GMC family oxidoreductase n=1 Tax=Haloarchaeobius salinus TaxID=1198298 RepID=UPI00210DAD71|nr:GMC family oxidoreductase [Haloarchaeobius salinus]
MSRSSAGDDVDRTPSPRADVCIVGAGPAGALVAHRLASQGHDVVVLEAGPRFDPADRLERMERHIRPSHGPEEVWDMGGPRDAYTNAGGRFYPLNAARVKGVGGTTLHWQGMVFRLHEDDFERRSRHGVERDWPIGYDDLQPYYAEAEAELGVAGADDNPFAPPREEPFPMPGFRPSYSDSLFAGACEELGIAMHSAPNARNSEAFDGRSPCQGYGTCKPVCPSGAKYDATVHVAKAEDEGARIVDRVPVQRIEHDRSGETVDAVVYATPDGEEHRQEARQFVLAAGGIETPRLLLLSRSEQHPDGLANSSGAVGRYFMDHLFAGMGGELDEPTRQKHVGFITSECHQFYDDVDDSVGPYKLEFLNYAGPSPVDIALSTESEAAWGDALADEIRGAYGNRLAMGGLCGQPPRAENRVTLNPDVTDDHGNPVPEIHWSLGARERRTIEAANERQAAIMDELGVDVDWVTGPDATGPAFHHMGTTRMGTDPAESVVRPDLRTHDLDNCWIASSSTFVTGGALNPTLTIAALALRAADAVSETL